MTDSFTFLPNEDGSLPLRSAVFQAIGAASVQWEDASGTGVFQSERANEIGEAVMAEIDKAHGGLQAALNNGAAKNADLSARVDNLEAVLRRVIDAADVTRDAIAPTEIHDAIGHELIGQLAMCSHYRDWVAAWSMPTLFGCYLMPSAELHVPASAGTHGEDVATHQGLLTNEEIEEVAALETTGGEKVVHRIEITNFRGVELSDETLRAVQAWHNRGPQA